MPMAGVIGVNTKTQTVTIADVINAQAQGSIPLTKVVSVKLPLVQETNLL
jgi:hypothetical protein